MNGTYYTNLNKRVDEAVTAAGKKAQEEHNANAEEAARGINEIYDNLPEKMDDSGAVSSDKEAANSPRNGDRNDV